ncbi:MAG TPA: Holliday junction branch migration protein RuvA [Thermotogota bacterium]|nr:Holliday junction branch migration protein RuvA [Thermotogota bacterium]
MFFFIEGTVVGKDESAQTIFLDCAPFGFELYVDTDLLSRANGEKVRVYTVFVPSEEEFRLYGFSEARKRYLFRALRSISGFGAKSALKVLSAATPEDLVQAVLEKDISFLTSLPGVGKKTAERMVLELSTKLDALSVTLPEKGMDHGELGLFQQALQGLEALGYTGNQARDVLRGLLAEKKTQTVEELIREALKKFLERKS